MSYSPYKTGPPRGRGFIPRGAHRGGASSVGGWGGGGRGRGSGDYSPPRSSRGRGGWHREPPSSSAYEHGRSSSSSRYSEMNEERYSSRSRDEVGFRRYPRQESPGYSMEGSSHHRSPESPRKRMRSDHGFPQASSHRRSHESSGYDFEPPRYERSSSSYEEKGYDRYREERRSYRDHHSGSGERYSPRDDFMHHRKDPKDSMVRHDMGRSSMPPPPPPMNPRHSASPRRSSFRGRGGLERGRGIRGRPSILRGHSTRGSRPSMSLRKPDGISSIKRKAMMESSYVIKKKILARTMDPAKKLRIQKIRRIKETLESSEGNEGATAGTEKENWDEEKGAKAEGSGEAVKGKVTAEGEEGAAVAKEKEGEATAEATDPKKEPVESPSVQVTIKQNSDGRAVNDDISHKPSGRRFIRLLCPHCHDRCVTFKQYTTHLYGSKHLTAMSRLMLRHKQTILRMRQQQRKQQREDEEHDDTLTKFSSFCPVCKLNYRQSRITHTTSKMHQEMKKFLFPYCKVCGIPFKATMLYDKHICSLDHIRREAYMEERLRQLEGRERGGKRDDEEMDMDGFMIVDSVGDVDDAEEMDAEKTIEKAGPESLVGLEFIKAVEAQYCDLCQRYLPRLDDAERAQAVHCRSSQHLRLFRDEQRVSRAQATASAPAEPEAVKPAVETEQNGDAKEDAEEEEEGGEGDGNASEVLGLEIGEAAETPAEGEREEEAGEEDDGAEEKLWADVDKDLGELLGEVEPEEDEKAKSSEDDDEESVADSGRYDRFKYSEKGKEKDAGAVTEDDKVKIESSTPDK